VTTSARSVSKHFVRGTGPDLFVKTIGAGDHSKILLHGIGSSGMSWLPVMTSLAADARLIIPDLRGHGQSGHPDTGYLLDDYADDLERLIAHFGVERPILIGHSLGGLTTVTWAKRHPDTALAIVLEDMPLSGGPDRAPMLEEWAQLAAMSPEAVVEHYRLRHPAWSEDDCVRRANMLTSTHQAVFLEMRNHAMTGSGIDYLAGLSAIQSPIALLHGDVDAGGLVPEAGAARFAALGPNFRTVSIPGASHAIHRDSTEPFLRETRAFLADAINDRLLDAWSPHLLM
jgi:pimeloyl-ACP methyl ester carboxylesterase